jgi:hypothetical protein
LSIGISPADAYLNFVPNYEYVLDYSIDSYRPFTFYVEGPFSEYSKIETIEQTDRRGLFKVHIMMPENYPTPGKQKMFVAAKETPTGAGISAVAIIRGFVEIDVPFPGFYATIDLSTDDVNEGEPVYVSAVVRNKGKENITYARLELEIYSDTNIVKTLKSERFNLETTGEYTFSQTILGSDLRPGEYEIKASLYYEGDTVKKSAKFRVGTFDVSIINYTGRMFNNSINPFEIEVASKWNNKIDTVYMDLAIRNGSNVLSSVKTPPFDLLPWENKKSSFYWNTAGIPVGEYDLEIIIHYDQQTKVENRKVYIVENTPVKESPSVSLTTILLIVVVVLLVLFNTYYIINRKKEKKEKEGEK